MEENNIHETVHRDDHASRIGMWLFVFTEMYFFGGLFTVYAVYRFIYADAFHLAAKELDITLGTINSIILLLSGMTIGISLSFIQRAKQKKAIFFLMATIVLGIIFLVIKFFEWEGKFEHGFYPSSQTLISLSKGDIMFFGLYFFDAGLSMLTLLTVWFSQIQLPQILIVSIIMVIATIQAAIVFFYNMHLKFHEKILVVFASGVFGLLLVLVFATLFDYIFR